MYGHLHELQLKADWHQNTLYLKLFDHILLVINPKNRTYIINCENYVGITTFFKIKLHYLLHTQIQYVLLTSTLVIIVSLPSQFILYTAS